jgi:hypothetical protein
MYNYSRKEPEVKLRKLLLALCLLAFALVVVQPVVADSCPRAVQIAEATPCVQTQLQPLRDSGNYNERQTVTLNGNGTATVTFTFEPKCRHSNPPCLLADQIVTATVDCTAGTATCP